MTLDPQQEKDAELGRAGADLDRAREKVVLSLGAVQREIKQALDWREWVRRWPRTALAVAFAAGVFVGRRRSKRQSDR